MSVDVTKNLEAINPLHISSLCFGKNLTVSWESVDLSDKISQLMEEVVDEYECATGTKFDRNDKSLQMMVSATVSTKLADIMIDMYCRPSCLSLANSLVVKHAEGK